MKRLIAFFVSVTVISLSCLTVAAHPSLLGTTFDKTTRGGKTYVGTETIGWLLNENRHTNGQHLTYKCAAGMSTDLWTLISQGAEKWGDNDPFKIEYDSAAIGTVMVSAQVDPDAWADFNGYSADSAGHLTSWFIRLNSAYLTSITPLVIAHEFGHAFGLADLYNSSNSNKLIYGIYDEQNPPNLTAPAAKDIWGAKIITGKHTSHSWEYVFVSNDKHRRRCTSCGGYKTQGCTPNSSGYCTKCGHYVSNSGNGVTDPTAALLPNADEERRFMLGILN